MCCTVRHCSTVIRCTCPIRGGLRHPIALRGGYAVDRTIDEPTALDSVCDCCSGLGKTRRRCTDPDIDTADENLTQELESSDKRAQEARNAEMADCRADLEPGTFVSDHVEEVECHDVRDGHDHHKQGAGSDLKPTVQDSQVCTDDGEGDEKLENEQRTLAERVEDWDKPVHAVK